MKAYTLYGDQMSEHVNMGVDCFLNGLLNEKVITKDQYDEYRKYRLALVPTTFWGKFWKIFKSTDPSNDLAYYVVKPISTVFPTTNNNNTQE